LYRVLPVQNISCYGHVAMHVVDPVIKEKIVLRVKVKLFYLT
jgi:hypothetical protein